MSESGVIPPPGDRTPEWNWLGMVRDVRRLAVQVGTRDGRICLAINGWGAELPRAEAEEFARLFITACWEATMPP